MFLHEIESIKISLCGVFVILVLQAYSNMSTLRCSSILLKQNTNPERRMTKLSGAQCYAQLSAGRKKLLYECLV